MREDDGWGRIEAAALIDLLANGFDRAGLMAWVAMRWDDAGIPADRWRPMLEGWLAGQDAPAPDDEVIRRLRATIEEMAGDMIPHGRRG